MYIYIYIYMYLYMYMYIYIYIYTLPGRVATAWAVGGQLSGRAFHHQLAAAEVAEAIANEWQSEWD